MYNYSFTNHPKLHKQNKPGYPCILIFSIGILLCSTSYSQELEPRSLTNVPVRTNFAAMVYNYAAGNILYDQALPLEDVNAKTNTIVGAYVRSLDFFGMGAKCNVILPYAVGNWEGIYQGIDTTTSRNGLADLQFGFSFNFIGSPAIDKAEFMSFLQKTIAGFSLQVVAPTGQYFEDRLINLGSNRWAFRPQLGVSHKINSWFIEYSLNTWIYTTNYSFLNGNKLRQKPLGTLKLHIIKSFEKGIWAALGAGYAYGGRVYLNNERRETNISTMRFGAVLAVPMHPKHSLKLMIVSAKRFQEGADFNAITLGYQYVWNK